MKENIYLLILLLLLEQAAGQTTIRTIAAGRYDPIFNKAPKIVPTSKTPDAPLAGNGDIGVVQGGAPDALTFYLGKNDCWRAYPVYPGGGIALPGGLTLLMPDLGSAVYHARERMDKAAIESEFDKDDLHLSLNTWVTATHNTVIIECAANRATRVKLRLWAKSGNTSVNTSGRSGDVYWVTRSFENTPLLAWPCHIAIAMKVTGSRVSTDSVVELLPGRPVTISVTLYSNFDAGDWKTAAIREAQQLTSTGMRAWRHEHEQWWQQFWQQSDVEINDPFLQQYYYVSQYLLACSTRKGKFPPGIWGPFITQDSTAWGGDYHLNYNYEAPLWAAYSSNHIDLTDNYDQPLLDYMSEGRRLAKDLLNMPGIYYPVGLGPKGLVTTRWPLTPEEMLERYGTRDNNIDQGYKILGQKINAVFGSANMFMRFYSTYDRAYAERIYPYLLACADFWEHYLSFEDGRYVIHMDHFNEVMPTLRTKGQWQDRLGDFNSTLSLGLVTMLFRGIIDVSAWLQRNQQRRQRWEDILHHLSKFSLGEKEGRLSLKNMERGPGNTDAAPAGLNRVSIHGLLMPGGVAGPYTDSAINNILLNDVAHWADRMKGPGEWGNTLGNGIETCFPGAVRVGYDPGVILQQLKDRIALTALPNGWITQTGGGIETLAAVPLTINEMLLQSYEGVLRVFPVWDHRKDASFDQLRAYGAFLVSSRLKNGWVEFVRMTSEKGRSCHMENPWPGEKVQLVRNGHPSAVLSGKRLYFTTSPGEKILLVPGDAEWQRLSGLLSGLQASWTAPPRDIINTKLTTGMLMGNGDIGVVAGDSTQRQTFYFGKSDFWGASVKNPDAHADAIWQDAILSVGGLTISADEVSAGGLSVSGGEVHSAGGGTGGGEMYSMQQDILHAEVRTRMQLGKAAVEMTSWTADTDPASGKNFFITELVSDKDVLLDARLWVPTTYKAGGKWRDCADVYPYSSGVAGGVPWAGRENFNNPRSDHGGDYKVKAAMAMRVLGAGMQDVVEGVGNVVARLQLKAGVRRYIVISFSTDKWIGREKNTSIAAIADTAIRKALTLDMAAIDVLKTAHRQWWKDYWLKSYVDLYDTTFNRFYYGSLYMLGSAIRPGFLPPSLYGSWITTDRATWGGRYFLNYNQQAALYGVYSANRPELALPYIDLILHEMPWQRNKTHAAGFEGVCHQRSITPYHMISPPPDPLPVAPVKNISKLPTDQKSNSVFVALPLIWYYEYTSDLRYLKDTLYPYLKELDAFYSSYISKDSLPYTIVHSSAHEGSDDVNPNLDIGFIRKLYRTLIKAASTLQCDKDRVSSWQDMLDHLSDYPTVIRNGQKVFVEAAVMKGSTDPSRLFHPGDQPVNLEGAVFPGENIYLGSDTAQLRIALQSLDQLGGWCVNQGGSEHNGFPKHWPVAARIGWPATDLYQRLKTAIAFHWRASNYTAFQGGGGIETAGAIEGIHSMLLQSEGGMIRLFPVWPLSKDASFTRLRAKGAFLVSAGLKNGKITHVEIVSGAGGTVSIKRPWQAGKVVVYDVTDGGKEPVLPSSSSDKITFFSKTGHRYLLEVKSE